MTGIFALNGSVLLAGVDASEARDLSGGRYFPVVEALIKGARKDVWLAMYSIKLTRPDGRTARLLRALAEAEARGVRVNVVLDREEAVEDLASQQAVLALQARQVPLRFDLDADAMHTKLLVVDGEWVVLGSADWTEEGLSRNREASVLIHSSDLAHELLEYVESIPKAVMLEPPLPGVRLAPAFFKERGLVRFVQFNDERGLKVFLTFLKLRQEQTQGDILEGIASELGLAEEMGRSAYRAELERILKRLARPDGVLAVPSGSRFQVEDLRAKSPAFSPGAGGATVPKILWERGWIRRLSLAGLSSYLLALRREQAAEKNDRGFWPTELDNASKETGLSHWYIRLGFRELERLGIVESSGSSARFAPLGNQQARMSVQADAAPVIE